MPLPLQFISDIQTILMSEAYIVAGGNVKGGALGPRHVAALQQLRGGQVTVSELADRLGLTLPTVSGVLADLDPAQPTGPAQSP
jgi:hypothetical protein